MYRAERTQLQSTEWKREERRNGASQVRNPEAPEAHAGRQGQRPSGPQNHGGRGRQVRVWQPERRAPDVPRSCQKIRGAGGPVQEGVRAQAAREGERRVTQHQGRSGTPQGPQPRRDVSTSLTEAPRCVTPKHPGKTRGRGDAPRRSRVEGDRDLSQSSGGAWSAASQRLEGEDRPARPPSREERRETERRRQEEQQPGRAARWGAR